MSEPRRALFLFPSDRMGGAERVTRTLALEAARSGRYDVVDCFILCWDRSGTLDRLEQLGNVRLHYTLARGERGGVLALLGILSRRRYDLVFSSHTHLNAACSGARRIGLLRTKRLVSRESTLMFERTFRGEEHIYRALYRLYGKQDLIVCQTERMRASLDKHTGHRFRGLLTVLPNPIDAERIAEGRRMAPPAALDNIPPGRRPIAWCGRLSEVKSPLRAVDVLRELHDRGARDMHLVFIGDGPLRQATEDHAAKRGLAEFVTFTGHMANPVPALTRCEVGLVTSDVEGFPNVILEMLAAGIRGVATTDCAGGLKRIPGLCIANENTAAALADAMEGAQTESDISSVPEFLSLRAPSHYLDQIEERQ